MAPTGSSHLSFTMAGLMALGGGMGYVKAKSLPSLAGGMAAAALYAGAGMAINRGKPYEGHSVATVTSWALVTGMGYRALKAKKVGPAHAVAGIALISMLYEGRQAHTWYEAEYGE